MQAEAADLQANPRGNYTRFTLRPRKPQNITRWKIPKTNLQFAENYMKVHGLFDHFTTTPRSKHALSVSDYIQETPPNITYTRQDFAASASVKEFLNSTTNHDLILDLLAHHRVERNLNEVDRGPRARTKTETTETSVFDDGSYTYTFEELELLDALTPLKTRRVALRVAVGIAHVKYFDYCNAGKVTGRLLLHKCIQLFTLTNPKKVGNLSKFGFSQAELAALKVG